LEVVFSVRSVPRLYNEDQSSEMADRRGGGWRDVAASLRERDPRSRGSSTVGRCHQEEQ
jgi:hypothetical protein